MTNASPNRSARGGLYVTVGLLLAIWMVGLTVIASTVIPDLYWFSYYSIGYQLGFVRRGLAGQLVNMFPAQEYFSVLRLVRWVPTGFYAAGLMVLGWAVAVRSGSSERRLMMALLVPVLPFGFTFALFSARPDLIGAFALIIFATILRFTSDGRAVAVASATYGLLTALVAFTHEATPFLFGLGAILALTVLGRDLRGNLLRLCCVLAIAPGLLASSIIALFGRRGISTELCEIIPHGAVNWPASGHPTVGQILGGFRFDVDYHDWICRNIVPLYDQSFSDALRYVANIGPLLLGAATAIGVLLFVASLLAISHVSGVPLGRFWRIARTRTTWIVFGAALFLPIFMTGVDWIRWWVTASLDVGVVFLLFASSQSEARMVPTRQARLVFIAGTTLLALFPIGILPGFGAPVPM